jgi:hypothetical protein
VLDDKLNDVEITFFSCSTRFILDSGCSKHMCASLTKFDEVNYLKTPIAVEVADGKHINALAVGSIGILEDVYYVPQLKRNLISISAFEKKGHSVLFEGGEVYMRKTKECEFELVGVRDGSLYETVPDFEVVYDQPSGGSDSSMEVEASDEFAGSVVEHTSDLDLWHERLAHLGYDNVRHMHRKDTVTGMNVHDGSFRKEHFCDSCASAKATLRSPKAEFSSYRDQPGKKRFKKIDVTAYFKEVNSDLIGPMQVQGIDGSRYAITFCETKSRMRWLYTMKSKAETTIKIKEFRDEIMAMGFSLRLLKTDNGGEFVNDELKDFAAGKFTLRTTPPHTPKSNALAERFNRVLGERTRAMLKHKNLPTFLWPEAMKTITYLSNRTTTVAVGNRLLTPVEILTGIKPDVSHLRVFGCKAFAYNFDIHRKKLDDKAKAGVFVGYDNSSAAYRIYLTGQRKIIKSGHVMFNERGQITWGNIVQPALDNDWYLGLNEEGESEVDDEGNPLPLLPIPAAHGNVDEEAINELIREGRAAAEANPINPPAVNDEEKEDIPRRETRGVKRDYRAMHFGANRAGGERAYSVRETILYSLKNSMADVQEPKTFTEALESECAEEWQQAINSEVASIYQNEVWRQADLPPGVKPLTTKWVFKVKRGKQGQIEKFKARLCVRGFEQEKGVDYDEIFSPVMRHNSLRVLLALAAVHDYEIKQMDVKTAFLHGELEEDVYIYAPEGAGYPDGAILKLDKSLYGLKQAPRVFNDALNDHLERIGFKRCESDPCVYIKHTDSGPIYMAVYVDDLLLIGKNLIEINTIKSDLSQQFDMDDRGDASFILGMSIERDRAARTLELSQAQYARNVVKRFKMKDSKCKLGIPIHSKVQLSADDCPVHEDDINDMKKVPFRSAIGALMYLATCTRPDISYAVSVCASYMHNPGRVHWDIVKGILAYVNYTSTRGIIFGSRECTDDWTDTIYLYVDADHAGNVDNRRSRTGYVSMLHGGAISWKTRLQERTSISSTEAEYYAASDAFGEARWFRMFLAELQVDQVKPTVILEDNQSCINLAQNPVYQYRTKQIDIRHHQLREGVKYKEISLVHVSTVDQVADSMTKGLETRLFKDLTNRCMMHI